MPVRGRGGHCWGRRHTALLRAQWRFAGSVPPSREQPNRGSVGGGTQASGSSSSAPAGPGQVLSSQRPSHWPLHDVGRGTQLLLSFLYSALWGRGRTPPGWGLITCQRPHTGHRGHKPAAKLPFWFACLCIFFPQKRPQEEFPGLEGEFGRTWAPSPNTA